VIRVSFVIAIEIVVTVVKWVVTSVIRVIASSVPLKHVTKIANPNTHYVDAVPDFVPDLLGDRCVFWLDVSISGDESLEFSIESSYCPEINLEISEGERVAAPVWVDTQGRSVGADGA
jgi:hypothetical protein